MNAPKLATPELVSAAVRESGGAICVIDKYSLNRVGMIEFGPIQFPSVSLVVPPNDIFNATNPETGFPGTYVPRHPKKYLRIWADDLLTVSHDGAYTFILNSTEPLDRKWIDQFSWAPFIVSVLIYPFSLPISRVYKGSELEIAATPSALFVLEDRR